MHNKDKKVILIWALILGGMMIVVGLIVTVLVALNIQAHAPATAEVLEIKTEVIEEVTTPYFRGAVVRFDTPDGPVTTTLTQKAAAKLQKGDTVDLRYRIDNPTEATLSQVDYFVSGMLLAVGVVFALSGTVFYLYKPRHERIRKSEE